ncbi:Plant disease resistance response protein [Macleaya cordata]|uniref:Dirigent protein n=1 Tax=Macleaya cordata TaxID=56857 RepID=A0A200PRY6_MACCD|nr:Plant disease resistance response protein [Macleaya cordata]
MANSVISSSYFISYVFMFIIICFSNYLTTTINGENSEEFSEIILMGRNEKISHLHFYFHDTVSGKNPTAVQIAAPTAKKSGSFFGITMIIDDKLTEGPEPTSKIIGRAQGIYAIAAQEEIGLLMNMNLVFMEGKYNGSTLSVLGRNAVFHPVREMPIVGGSGLFRFARGYALAKTVWFKKSGDALVEYNVSVIHF